MNNKKKCIFKYRETKIICPAGDPSTWYPKGEYDACELRFSGNEIFGFKECIGEDKCPITKRK